MVDEQQEDSSRSLPTSDLDLNLMITNNVWGSSEVSPILKETLNRYYLEKDDKGEEYVKTSSMWGLLNFYTRDIRLGNLSVWNGELQLCRHYLDLAGQLLYAGLIQSFLVALSKAITIIETSQSKNGFLRGMMNTLRNEHINQNLEPPKKGFFGGSKDNRQQQGGGVF